MEEKAPDKKDQNKSSRLLFCFVIALGWGLIIYDNHSVRYDIAFSIILVTVILLVSILFISIRPIPRWFDIIFFIIAPLVFIGDISILGDKSYAIYLIILGVLNKYWMFEDKFFNNKKDVSN